MTARPYHVVRIGGLSVHLEETLEYDRQQAAALGMTCAYAQCAPAELLAEALRPAQIVLAGCRLTRASIEAIPDLKLIICPSVGFEHVDTDTATERGIVVANLPLNNVDAVADHAMALLLACARRITMVDHAMRRGQWGIDLILPTPGFGKQVLGIIGLGNIGRRVAQRARAFGLRVLANDPYITQETATEFGATLVGLDELLARADYVSVHTPHNAETHHLMGERQFRAMKPTAYYVSTCRGKVTDEPALIRALQDGWIAGAGLDVFEQEPIAPDNPLLSLENVIVSPHLAGYSEVSVENNRAMAWDMIRDFITGRWPASIVNPAVRERVRV